MEGSALCILDEAGFVGFAETQPTKPLHSHAIGVVGGLLIPSGAASVCEAELGKLLSKALEEHTGKSHACELFRDRKHADVRENVFAFLLSLEKCLVVYEAAYAEGILQERDSLQEIVGQARQMGGLDPLPEGRARTRILTVLYRGIIFQVDEVCRSFVIPEAEILTDQVDCGLLKEQLTQLRGLQRNTSVRELTTWTEETGVIRGTIEVRTPGFDNRTNCVVGITVDTNHPCLVLAADMVVNSLYHLLREHRERQGGFPPLHDGAGLKGFKLLDRVAFVASGYFTDRVYRPAER